MNGILFIYKNYDEKAMGGIQRKILLIAESLYKKGLFEPVLLTGQENSIFADSFRRLGFAVYSAPMDLSGLVCRAFDIAEKITQKHNIKIVQSHMLRESAIGRYLKKKNKSLIHIFRVHIYIEGTIKSGLKRQIYHLFDKWTSDKVDLYVPISKIIYEELISESWINPLKIRIVPNGTLPLGTSDMLAESGLLHREMAIIGDLQERKNQALAVKAIGLLKKRGVSIRLHLIGKELDGYLNTISKTAHEYEAEDMIVLHDYQDQKNIPDLLRNVPVIILSSDHEGIPTSIIEGMSLRKLCIATDAGGTAELVKNKENGFLFQRGNLEQLCGILEYVFTTPAREFNKLRESGFQTWQKEYSLDNMINGLVEVYREFGFACSPEAEIGVQ